MNTLEILAKIRARACLPESSKVGVVGSYCKAAASTVHGRDIVSFVNTMDIDSDDEVVVPAGADWTYVLSNRQVFVDHQYGTNTAVGHVRSLVPFPRTGEQHAWEARTGIYDKPGNKIGDDILTMARECGIGASVGFLATDYGPPNAEEVKAFGRRGMGIPRAVVRKWKALEYSLTAFPCNVSCQGEAVLGSETEKRYNLIDAMVVKGIIRRSTANMLGAPIESKRRFHATTNGRTVWVVD